MNDRITDLLHEVADDVEPGDRLDAIRAEIGVRRPGRGWWAAGGVGLVAASVVAGLALTTGGTPSRGPGPASPPSPMGETGSHVLAVYFLGETNNGLRLFREFQRLPGDRLQAAVSAAVGRDADDLWQPPLDADYRVPWPSVTTARARLDPRGDVIEISLSHLGGSLRTRGDIPAPEAELAVEQLIRTAQAAVGERLPVRFLLDGDITDQVLGVPTSEPVVEGDPARTLAAVSIADPSEDLVVDNDDPLVVKWSRNNYRGPVVINVQGYDRPVMAATLEHSAGDAFGEQRDVFAPGTIAPGDYLVVVATRDGSRTIQSDTRRITVVD